MRGMPLPFDLEGKGVLDLELLLKNGGFLGDFGVGFHKNCFLDTGFTEPTSVLESARISRRPSSSSTLSSSFGGGGGAASTDTAGVAAISDTNPSPKWQPDSNTATSSNVGRPESELLPIPPSLEIGAACGGAGNAEKCAMEDWESVLSDSVGASPSQEQSIIRWIMGDVEDPVMAGSLNKVLQIGGGGTGGSAEYDFSGGFGAVDHGFGGEDQIGANFMSTIQSFSSLNRSNAQKTGFSSTQTSSNLAGNYKFPPNSPNLVYPSAGSNLGAIYLHPHATFDSSSEPKPSNFNPLLLINQHQAQQAQNPSFFLPVTCTQQQEQNLFTPASQAKREISGSVVGGGGGGGGELGVQEMLMGRQQWQQQQAIPQHLQFLPNYQHRPAGSSTPKPKIGGAVELGSFHQQHQQQQAIIDQLYKAAELVQTGNPLLAQGILARLNHHLSPIDKPFQRAAFYFKEALQLLLHSTNNLDPPSTTSLPFSILFKIGAYKAFSEISPIVQFANFTCNQALLEAVDGYDRIHIVDFDIGYGGQWASLIQELALRSGGLPSLKITALASPSVHDQIDLGLTRENLIQFASEINITLEFETLSIESMNSGTWCQSLHLSENEVVAVNLPVSPLANHQLSVPLVLHFVKQLSPRIIVSVDRGCDRTDLSFANHTIHALQSYSNLLEFLDAANVNADVLQKIERFLLQPGIEKIMMARFRAPEKTQHWRTVFLSSGLSPVSFSNFSESQAECVVKRTPIRGFQVEKRQSSLVLSWQRKELISASAWRC